MHIKTLLYLPMLLLASLAVSCSEDTYGGFDSALKADNFSFRPIAGGAIMHYTFPKDEDVVGMTVSYNDYSGKECLLSASPMADSLKIVGFNEAKENVPAQVRYQKRNGEESLPINLTFSTHDSGPVAFFKGLKVQSGWNGFTVITDNPAESSGMAHVFYLGTNPYTNKEDTLLLQSFNIKEGTDTMIFKTNQKKEINTIVVRTEDFRGYMVKQEVFENIASYNTEKLPADQMDVEWSKIIEDPEYMLGKEWLTDGDSKGVKFFADNDGERHFRMTIAGPEAIGVPMYVDMKKNRLTAEVKFFEPLWLQGRYVYSGYPNSKLITFDFPSKVPCDITVYGAKDDGISAGDWDSKTWKKIGSYKQDRLIDAKLRWSYGCWYDFNDGRGVSKEDVDTTDPLSCSVGVPADGQDGGYRYLKIVINDTFDQSNDSYHKSGNIAKYIFLSEMEIYTKKDE